MDFLEFFNLNEDPFRLTPDPFYFFPSDSHNELLSSLNYVIEQKEGFFLAIGEPGTGKTTILKVFINTWKDKALIALVMTPRLSPEDFLSTVMEDLNVKVESSNKNDIIRSFRDFLVETALKGKRVIIIVDEAQNMPYETLEELRLLSNLETEKEKLLQIVLMGQPQLKKILSSNDLKQLNQRVTVRCSLKSLSMNETADYINYRLIKGGKGNASFEREASKAVYTYSKGTPRLINLVSSRAMMSAYLDGSNVVSKPHVIYTIKHLADENDDIGSPVKLESKKNRYIAAAVLLISIFALAVTIAVKYMPDMMWYNSKPAIISPQSETKGSPELETITDDAELQTDIQKEPEVFEEDTKEVTEEVIAETTEEVTAEAIVEVIEDTTENVTEETVIEPVEETIEETIAEEKIKKITATLMVKSANVRAKPRLGSEVVAWITKDMDFQIINKIKDNDGRTWHKIHLADGREGWISGNIIKLTK